MKTSGFTINVWISFQFCKYFDNYRCAKFTRITKLYFLKCVFKGKIAKLDYNREDGLTKISWFWNTNNRKSGT